MEILERINAFRLVLASQSPRRKFLLNEIGLKFEVIVPQVDEIYPENMAQSEVPSFLASMKAEALKSELSKPQTILIAADTIVVLNNTIIGKPLDRSDAYKMLKELSGNCHQVLTGVCVKSAHKSTIFTVNSKVWFRELSDCEIDYYIDTYKPYDKAGAYGIQEWIGYIGIERIDGSFHNVMGLPIARLFSVLKSFME